MTESIVVKVKNILTGKSDDWTFTDWMEFYGSALAQHIGYAFMNGFEVEFDGGPVAGNLTIRNLDGDLTDELNWQMIDG